MTVNAGVNFQLTGTQSADTAPGEIVRFRWTSLTSSFTNMPVNVPLETTGSTFIVQVNAANQTLGEKRFRLVVIDDSGNESLPTEVAVIIVDNQAPTAVLTAPARVEVGASFQLSGANSSDPAPGKISVFQFTNLDCAGLRNWAVGETLQTDTPTLNASPANTNVQSPIGRCRFSLRVSDDSGNDSAAAQAEVVFSDTTRPTAVITGPSSVNRLSQFTLSGANSFDPNGGRIVSYRWTNVSLVSAQNFPVGATIVTSSTTLTVTPASNGFATGTSRLRLVVVDAAGNESSAVEHFITVTQ